MALEKFLLSLGVPRPTYDSEMTEQDIEKVEKDLWNRAQRLGPRIWVLIDTYGESGVRAEGPTTRYRGSKLIHLCELALPDPEGQTDSFITLSTNLTRGYFDSVDAHFFVANEDGTGSKDIRDGFAWPAWGNGDDRDINQLEALVLEIEARPKPV